MGLYSLRYIVEEVDEDGFTTGDSWTFDSLIEAENFAIPLGYVIVDTED